jgi:ABC-2 type transport system ATP-binding protein
VSGQDTPAIRTAGLGKRYGSAWALQDCSVLVPRGRVSALVGPNGAGKTTLLKILAGLSAPSAGDAAVLGRPPAQDGDSWPASATWPRTCRSTSG